MLRKKLFWQRYTARQAHLSVWQFVALLKRRAGGGSGHLLFEVERHVAQLLLDVTNDLTLGRRREAVAALRQDLHQVVGQITAGQIQTQDGVRQRVALVDRHSVCDAVARVQHDTCCTTAGVQRQHGLDSDVHRRRVERLEHYLQPQQIYPQTVTIRFITNLLLHSCSS